MPRVVSFSNTGKVHKISAQSLNGVAQRVLVSWSSGDDTEMLDLSLGEVVVPAGEASCTVDVQFMNGSWNSSVDYNLVTAGSTKTLNVSNTTMGGPYEDSKVEIDD